MPFLCGLHNLIAVFLLSSGARRNAAAPEHERTDKLSVRMNDVEQMARAAMAAKKRVAEHENKFWNLKCASTKLRLLAFADGNYDVFLFSAACVVQFKHRL